MECKKCRYLNIVNNNPVVLNICSITHVCNVKSCNYISDDNEVNNMEICYNCNSWIGLGDWGLSCSENYYNCSCNGFDEACEEFVRKKE